jgi:hypothetical protein
MFSRNVLVTGRMHALSHRSDPTWPVHFRHAKKGWIGRCSRSLLDTRKICQFKISGEAFVSFIYG